MTLSARCVQRRCLWLVVVALSSASSVLLAQPRVARGEPQVPIPGLPKPPPSPALSADEAQKTFQLADGFKIELAASDPTIQDPISIAFDADGRLFVVEMRGFMPTINREGELDQTGRISLLEDADQDGRFEKATVFVDRLVLPRAVAAVQGGILYVSASKLWFAQDTDGDGKADRTELIDPNYGIGGNVEHAPNGLMRAMDNWIYNAKSLYRYRFISGVWIKQRTEFRGQWGMTQDNFGRLLYNVNDNQLLGDIAPPNYMGRNPHHRTTNGLTLTITTNQQIFSIRMNTAINRGYSTNVLDQAGHARAFASSCSPLVYRGDNYPDAFQGNVFVCDPAVNLIKRNLLFDHGLAMTSKFAYDRSEFLASTDERFRPVNVFNGPDGTLWVVDMYRGVIQYGLFMSSYLRRESLERGLDKDIHLGRIYRIVSTNKTPAKSPRLSKESAVALVGRLSHPNGWIRDTAQRLLIELGDLAVVPQLTQLALNGPDPFSRVHALWTLEGLFLRLPKNLNLVAAGSSEQSRASGSASNDADKAAGKLVSVEPTLVLEAPALTSEVLDAIVKVVDDPHPKVQIAAIRVAESLTSCSAPRQKTLLQKLARLGATRTSEVVFQAALSAGNLAKPDGLNVLAGIASQHAELSLLRDAILSGLKDWELQFLQRLLADRQWEINQPGRESLLHALASAVVKERQPEKVEMLLTLAANQKAGQAWRQRSLLEGIAAHATNRFFEPIASANGPIALEFLAKSDDPQLREQGERFKRLFSRPGDPSAQPVVKASSVRPMTAKEKAIFAEGKVLFQQICAGCHGLNGEGVSPVAPPLANSSWVLGANSRLIRIVLHGLEGPIEVSGTRYEPPIVMHDMPALEVLDDGAIAAILNYIRRDWGHEADPVPPEEVARIRRATTNRQQPWTEPELLQIK